MKRIKKLIAPFCVLIIIVAAFFVIINWKEEDVVETIRTRRNEENEKLKFVLDGKTTQFQVEMKDNGDVWYSNPPDAANDAKAVILEKENLQSTLLLKYSTINGVDTQYNSYEYSIVNGLYEVEQGADYVKVNYTIGNVEKEYIIPKVIVASRMDELLAKMDTNGQGRVTNYYKKYDINNLSKKDNKEELLEAYPILQTEVIYVLRENAKDTMKGSMETIFEEAGYTMEEYVEGKKLVTAETISDLPIYNVSVIYRLEEEDLVVEIPLKEIEYRKEFPLVSLNILPYFGAGSVNENGYLMVPEGGGGIIRFNNGKIAQAAYYADIYGWNMAIDRKSLVHETNTYFNAFGIAKDTSAFLCILEDGASYASIQADISGKVNSYNYASATYSIVHRDQFDVTERYNGAMYVYEPNLPDENLIQRYRFQTSNNYEEMALNYRDYLTERFSDGFSEKPQAETPMVIEMIGAIDKVKQVFGVPVSKPLELTTYKEAEEILRELNSNGINNLSVKYSGFMNGGMNQKILDKVKLLSSVGDKEDLKAFTTAAKDMGIDVYLNGITNYAYDSSLLDGFNVLRDAARMVTKEKVMLYPYSSVTYSKQESMDPYYLLHAGKILTMMDNLEQTAKSYGANVSFQDVGSDLSADFYRKNPVTREAAKRAQTERLQKYRSNGSKIMINMGNEYALAYSDIITNMDLDGSSYTILDATVPIYQMAVHGYVTYTGESLNICSNIEEEILTSAEYGAGLSFTLMAESSIVLQDTQYSKYYGADYEAAKGELIRIYTRYNKELGHTFDQKMISHSQINDLLSCTTYEDGTKVYVNYSYDAIVTEDGTPVAARDYSVVR